MCFALSFYFYLPFHSIPSRRLIVGQQTILLWSHRVRRLLLSAKLRDSCQNQPPASLPPHPFPHHGPPHIHCVLIPFSFRRTHLTPSYRISTLTFIFARHTCVHPGQRRKYLRKGRVFNNAFKVGPMVMYAPLAFFFRLHLIPSLRVSCVDGHTD